MKRYLPYFFLILQCAFLSCSSGKNIVVHKENLSKIQNLVLLTPHLHIESYNKNGSVLDEKIASNLRIKATSIISSTLRGKYIIQNEPYYLLKNDEAALMVFFSELDTLKKDLSELRIPKTLHAEPVTDSNRYILATYISGFYHNEYPPNYAFRQGVSDNMIKLAQRPLLSGMNIRLIVADRITKEVLLYSTNQSYTLDPRLSPEVEQMLKSLLRPIYYK